MNSFASLYIYGHIDRHQIKAVPGIHLAHQSGVVGNGVVGQAHLALQKQVAGGHTVRSAEEVGIDQPLLIPLVHGFQIRLESIQQRRELDVRTACGDIVGIRRGILGKAGHAKTL